VQIGVSGAGWMGGVLLARFAERPDVRVAGVFNPDAARGRAALAAVGLPADRWVADYDALLRLPGLDAVCLASPNACHGPQALAALAAGKHVFCEKPCATRFADFRRQVEWARAHPGQQTLVDYILYFDTFEERLRRMIAAGEFGTVTQIQVNYRHPVNITGRKAWKLDAATMGDAIGMGVIHALSVMVFAMASQSKPVRVYATADARSVRGFTAPPLWNIHITFADGATGFCFGNIDHGLGYDAYHHVHGTSGALVFDSLADRPQKVRYWSAATTNGKWVSPLDPTRTPPALAWPLETTTPDSGDVVQHQTGAVVEHFIQCIRSGQESPLSFAQAAPIAELGWAAQLSAARGRPVDLPLDWDEAEAFFEKGME
jgi:predicted dehydrogenase